MTDLSALRPRRVFLVLLLMGAATAPAVAQGGAGGEPGGSGAGEDPTRAVPPVRFEGVGPGGSVRSRELLRELFRDKERRRTERRERRGRAGERERRRRSRREHRGLAGEGARRLLRERFAQELEPPVPDAASLVGPDRVEGFSGDFVARVVGSGGRPDRLIDSQVPLRAEDSDGVERLVDLGLERDAGAFVARNGPLDVRLGEGLADGFSLGPVGVRPEGDAAGAMLDQDTLTYANSVRDTDLSVNLTPTGLALYATLRSEDSPVEHRIALDLPEGAGLVGTEDGGARVVAGGEAWVSISPPVATDADGERVPAEYRVEGSELVLRVDHRGGDYLWPVLVDPEFRVVEDAACFPVCGNGWFSGSQNALSTLRFWDWFDNFAPAPYYGDTWAHRKRCLNDYGLNNCYGPIYGGGSNWNLGGGPRGTDSVGETGLHVMARPNVFYNAFTYGEHYYLPPGQTTRIYRADFGAKFLRMGSANRNIMMFTGIYSYPIQNWASARVYNGSEDGYDDGNLTHHWDAQFASGQPGPHAVAFGMGNFAAGPDYVRPWRDAYMGASIIELTDPEPPAIQTIGRSGPAGWTRDGAFTFAPRATDPGLGVRRMRLSVPLQGGGTATHERGVFCNGTRSLACDPDLTLPDPQWNLDAFRITAADGSPAPGAQPLPDGQVPITLTASDALAGAGHDATQTTTVQIDRSPPSSGSLTGISEGELLRDRDYTIAASAADALSGAKEVEITLDGARKAFRGDCPATTGPCQLNWTLDGGDATLTAGAHTIRVNARDQAGNGYTTVATRTFQVERTPPELDFEGTLKPPEGPWVPKGEQDLLFDAFDDGGTGVTHAELRLDGQPVQPGPPEQSCEGGGCDLSHDFVVDTSALAEGMHSLVLEARDAAGNVARSDPWTIQLERSSPSLSVSGSLKDSPGGLEPGATYTLDATAGDGQSGVIEVELAVDDEQVKTVQQGCLLGGCGSSASFEYTADEFETGAHTVTVTARDWAGNETTESFQVNNNEGTDPTCTSLPPVQPAPTIDPITPAEAEQRIRGAVPSMLAPSSTLNLIEQLLRPTLETVDDRFAATQAFAAASFDNTAGDGVLMTLPSFEEPNCLIPATASTGASDARPVADDAGSMSAVVYANTSPATDTVLRPIGTGLASVLQLRSDQAPIQFAYEVALGDGQQLSRLSGGEVAIVEPAAESALAPGVDPEIPAPPSRTERERALSDTQLGLAQASDDLERAQGVTPDRVVAVLPKPWAKDAAGNEIETPMSVSGSQITMTVPHTTSTDYPVNVGTLYQNREAAEDFQTMRAASETPDYAWDEPGSDTPPPAPTEPEPADLPPPAPEDPAADEAPLDEGDGAGGSSINDLPNVEDSGAPELAEFSRAVTQPSIDDSKIGISAADPDTIIDSDYRRASGAPASGQLNPTYQRPFAPWNTIGRGKEQFSAKLWRLWFRRAKPRGIKADIAIGRDTLIGDRGGVPNFTPDMYGRALTRFLRVYGGRDGVIDSLMAWNEPNFEGKETLPNGRRKSDPLYGDPRRAARLWIQAARACFPAVGPRCGHFEGNRFEKGLIVAGEFVGRPARNERKFPRRGKRRRTYNAIYHDQIKKLPRFKQPRVWGFHDYGDTKAFLLRRGSAKRALAVIKRFTRGRDRFTSDDYQYRTRDGQLRSPRIWLTEGGAPYTLACSDLGKESDLKNNCGGTSVQDRRKVLLFGMARQRNALAFLIREIAKRPAIERFYYFNFRSARGKCGPPREERENFRCVLFERGLIGTVDDTRFRNLAAQDNPFPVRPRDSGPGAFSQPGERRLAFCMLRDRKVQQVRKPNLVRRTGNPKHRCPG